MALPGLPSELIDQISNNMSYGSRLALKLSCRELLRKTDLPTKRYSIADLLEIGKWPEYNGAKSKPYRLPSPEASWPPRHSHYSKLHSVVSIHPHSRLLYRLCAQEATWPQICPAAERGGDRVETSTGPKLWLELFAFIVVISFWISRSVLSGLVDILNKVYPTREVEIIKICI